MKTVLMLLLLPALSHAALPAKPVPAPVVAVSPKTLLKATGGEVTFLAVGKPSMLKIHGHAAGPATKLSVDGNKLTGSAEFDMTKLETGISLRDHHMKEKYLEVQTFPKAVLTLEDAAVDGDFSKSLNNKSEQSFKGKLALHGKEQSVSGTFTVKNGLVEAKFPIKLTEFGIEIPSYLGVTVAENVDVNVSLPLAKE